MLANYANPPGAEEADSSSVYEQDLKDEKWIIQESQRWTNASKFFAPQSTASRKSVKKLALQTDRILIFSKNNIPERNSKSKNTLVYV